MELYNKNTFETTISKASKVYCSNDLTYGLKLLPVKNALNYNYIQVNNERVIAFLVIDLDHTNSFIFEKCKLPAPNFIVRTKEKGTSHLFYALKTPIPKSDFFKNRKALFLFSLIQQEYTRLLDGDPLYVNMIAKNPLSETWQVTELNRFGAYELQELADYITLPKRILKRNAIGVGRNCYLFESVRKFAYKEVLFYKNNGTNEADFRNVLLDRLSKLNTFSVPLGRNELNAIAKSISIWTWRNFSSAKFSQIQSSRRKKVKIKLREKLKNEFSTTE